MISRDRLVVVVGALLLAGGLLGLWLPVGLGDYDMYGIKVECGNGFHSQLLQATVDDHESTRPSATFQPATSYVGQCQSALAYRRGWAIPTAGLGALALTFEAAARARRRAMDSSSRAPSDTWVEAPDDYLHEAANLDRRWLPYREPPAGTTL